MADLSSQLTAIPRDPDVLDAIAEGRRVATQIMRSNPLRNAYTDGGLTRWKGRYGGEFLWIGEFSPPDPNKLDNAGNPLPQRAVSWVRDDPKQQTVLAAFDWEPKTGSPLRQKMLMEDADGRTMLQEGVTGGWGFPRFPIGLQPANSNVHNSTSSGNVAAWTRTQVVGRHIEYMVMIQTFALWPVQGAPGFGNVNVPLETAGAAGISVSCNLSVDIGASNITSPTVVLGAGGGFVSQTLDLGSAWLNRVSDYGVVNFKAWISAGDATRNAFAAHPLYAHNCTFWSDRTLDGL